MGPPASQPENNTTSTIPEKRKRTKYVNKACKECKRRKIKCGGQQPCERCQRHELECEYAADNVNSDSQNIEKLLQQVQSLQSRVESLSARPSSTSPDWRPEFLPGLTSTPNRDRMRPTRAPSFHGPTTSIFDLGIARKSLRDRGITGLERPGDFTQEPTPVASPSIPLHQDELLPFFSPPVEPFWAIGREEALRLCRVYQDEMGTMYPVIELESTITQVNRLYDHLGSLSSSRAPPSPVPIIKDEDINIIKMVFACALTAENSGRSELAMRIFRNVRDALANLMWRPADIQTAIIVTLVSIFFFQIDEEALAWRMIGMVQRMCMELGLHRAETYSEAGIVALGEHKASRLFWSVYALDVRWSMGTGMPNHLDFMDIEPTLPRPTGEPYLNSMIDYCRIAQKAWRILVRRPILLRAEHISQHLAEASTVVDIAKASIRHLNHLNKVCDIYRLQQVAFNWFLVSAVAVLFLAAAHAPAQFSTCSKDEFYMALELVEGFSMESYVSRRLWRSIRHLRQLAPQMSFLSQGQVSGPQEPVPTANMADSRESIGAPVSGTQTCLQDDNLQVDGAQMSRELMDMYEAMGESANTFGDQNSFNSNQWASSDNFMLGNGADLASVLKDLL
uniref:Zn(2)-C6 fungal-type domain-containing protein n=1 Tax=Bionectria ochroleuca TaxID=29856 RepID=A0A8H7K531_BIOOC